MPKIVKAFAKIHHITGDAIREVESAARISHRSENNMTEETWERFIINNVINHADWSVTEHAYVSVDFYVDRGITHELVRHRLFSFTQESTRFVNYEKKMSPSFIYPIPGVSCESCLSGDEALRDPQGKWWHVRRVPRDQQCGYNQAWVDAIWDAENKYKYLLIQGWRPQEARSVFPNALAAYIRMTGNLRNWRSFFMQRVSKESHPQMKEVTIPLLTQFREQIPLLYDDIVPEATQKENMSKAR